MFLNFLGASLGKTAAPPPTQSHLSLHSHLPDFSVAHHDPALPLNSWRSVQGPRRRWPGAALFTDRPLMDMRTVSKTETVDAGVTSFSPSLAWLRRNTQILSC